MDWRKALEKNNGDFAYGPHGEMIVHEDDDTYTVAVGDTMPSQYTRLSKSDISPLLKRLKVAADEWSFD